jgi:hypothetical protein
MRFEYIIPAAANRREVEGISEAQNEQGVRGMIRSMYGHEAAIEAIVRPVACALQAAVERKEPK